MSTRGKGRCEQGKNLLGVLVNVHDVNFLARGSCTQQGAVLHPSVPANGQSAHWEKELQDKAASENDQA